MFHRSTGKTSKNISNSLDSVFAEHEFTNTLQLWVFSAQAEGLNQTLKQPAQKLFALMTLSSTVLGHGDRENLL